MKTFKPTAESPEDRSKSLAEYLMHQDAQKIVRYSPRLFSAHFHGNVFSARCAISPLTIAVAFGAPFSITLDEETAIVAIMVAE